MILLKQFFKYEYCKKVMKNYFNKNLIISKKEEEQFHSSNVCWICRKLIDDDNEKIDFCPITGKFRDAAPWSRNVYLQLNKKVSVIFHNLRCYKTHLIFDKLNKFDVKIDVVIPNRLEKYVAFFLDKNLVFTDSFQFMNSSLEKLVKNFVKQ